MAEETSPTTEVNHASAGSRRAWAGALAVLGMLAVLSILADSGASDRWLAFGWFGMGGVLFALARASSDDAFAAVNLYTYAFLATGIALVTWFAGSMASRTEQLWGFAMLAVIVVSQTFVTAGSSDWTWAASALAFAVLGIAFLRWSSRSGESGHTDWAQDAVITAASFGIGILADRVSHAEDAFGFLAAAGLLGFSGYVVVRGPKLEMAAATAAAVLAALILDGVNPDWKRASLQGAEAAWSYVVRNTHSWMIWPVVLGSLNSLLQSFNAKRPAREIVFWPLLTAALVWLFLLLV